MALFFTFSFLQRDVLRSCKIKDRSFVLTKLNILDNDLDREKENFLDESISQRKGCVAGYVCIVKYEVISLEDNPNR